MPNIVTHALCANDVLQQLPNLEIKRVIQKYPRVFSMATSGPDFLFYYKALPFQDSKDAKPVHEIGNVIHKKWINKFYAKAIELIQAENENKEILLAFLAGHLMHWSLDHKAHPFVFNRSGEIAGESKYWHYRFESMIDTMMVKQIKGYRLNETKSYEFVDSLPEHRKIIGEFYRKIVLSVFNLDFPTEIYDECFVSMYSLSKMLFDPNTTKFPLVQAVEKTLDLYWKYSSHMVIGKLDTEHDVLNLNHTPWTHPCDNTEISTKSFVDLYDEAVLVGQAVLFRLNDIVFEKKKQSLDNILNDLGYDTGKANEMELKFYHSIY
jgi:hypothetical protein